MLEDENLNESQDFDEDEDERELLMNLTPAYLVWQEETLQRGRNEGKSEAQCEIALNLLKSGMNYEQVVQLTGLSMEIIQKLSQEIEGENAEN